MNKKLKLITLTGLIGLSSMSSFLVVSCNNKIETKEEAQKEQKPYEIKQEDLRIKLLSSAEENQGNDSNTNNLNEETIKNLKDTAEMLTDINKVMLLSEDFVIDNFSQNESIKKIKTNLEKEFSSLFELESTNTISKKEYHNVIKMIKSFNRTIQDMLLGKDLVQTPDGQQYKKEEFLDKYKKITDGIITYITPKPQYIEDYKNKSLELIESIFDNSLIKPLIPEDLTGMINGIITNLIQKGKISIDISDLKLTLELSDVGNLISTGLGIIKDQVTPITDLINKELSESGIDIRSPEVWNTKTLVEKVLPKIITSILKIDSISNIIPKELNQVINVLVNSVVGPFLLGILKESNLYDEQKNIDKIKEWATEGLEDGQEITGSNIYNVLKNVIQPLYEGLKNNSIISSVLNGLSQEQTYGIPSLIESVFVNFKYLNNLLNYHYYSNPENKNDNHSFLGDVLPKVLDWALELMPIKEIEKQEIKKEDEILKILKPYAKKDTVLNIDTLNYEDMDFANITMKEVNTIMSLYSESEIIKDSSLDIMITKIKQTYITDEQEAIIKEINDIWESDVKVIVNTFFNTKQQEANEFKDKLIRAIKEMDRMSVPYDFYIPDQYKIIEGLDVQDLFKSENGSYELKNIKKYLSFIKNNNDINKIVEGFIQPLWSDLGLDYATTGLQFSKTRYWTKENIKEVLLPNVLGFIDKFINIDQLKDIKIGKLLSDIITKNSTLIKDSDWEDLANVFNQSESEKVTGKMITDMIYKFMNILKNNAGESIDNLLNTQLNLINIKPVQTIEKIYNLIELIFEHKLKLWGFEDYQNPIQTILSYAIDFVIEIIEPKEHSMRLSRAKIFHVIKPYREDGTIQEELASLLTDYLEFSKDDLNISQSNKIAILNIESSKLKSIKESIVQVINENWKQMISNDWTSITEQQKNNMINNYNNILTK